MKMPVEYILGYRPDKCIKPDCLCIDIAIANNGGRQVKNYACLAKVETNQLKTIKMTVYRLRELLETQRGHEEIRVQLYDSILSDYIKLTVLRVYEDNDYNVVIKIDKEVEPYITTQKSEGGIN